MKTTVLKSVVAAIALGSLFLLGRQYFGELERLRNTSPIGVAGILLLFMVTHAMNGEVMRIVLTRLGHSIGRVEAFMVMVMRTYANLLVPRAGTGVPAMYLRVNHRVRLADFASLTLAVTSLQVICVGIAGAVCQALLWHVYDEPLNFLVAALFGAALLGGLAAVCLRSPIQLSWNGKFAEFLRRTQESWTLLCNTREMIMRVTLLQVVMLLLRAVRLQLAFWAIGQHANYWGVLVASLLSDLTILVSVTPMALGLREAVIGYAAEMAGTTPSIALTAAILDRLVWTIGVIVVAQLGLLRLLPSSLKHDPTQ